MELKTTEWILIGIAFSISIWNTAVGPTGGVVFAAMATLLPATVVVPIHAVTQASASIVRTVVLHEFIDWSFILPFVLGGLAGFALGVPLLHILVASTGSMQILLGGFILISTWVSLKRLGPEKGLYAGVGGTVTSFLTLFVGATMSLVVAAIGQRHENHKRVIGTTAGCMLYQHAAKIPIFGALGFSFAAYAELLVFLVIATAIGTWIGRRVLINASQAIIKPIIKTVLTVLAINLLWQGITSF